MLGGNFAALLLQPVPDVALLDGLTEGGRQGRLPADNIDGALECVHADKSTKRLVGLSTSSFVVTPGKAFCTVPGMAKSTYQQRIRFVIRRVGGQSELARQVNERYGTKLQPQNIQYLASDAPSGGKPAQGSRDTPRFAAVGGVLAEWLGTGKGPRDAPSQAPRQGKVKAAEPLTKVRIVLVKIKETGEKKAVELTTEALKVAEAFMKLDDESRQEILREVERKRRAIQLLRKLHAPPVPDSEGQLDHLAAPGTPTAIRAKARKAAKAPAVAPKISKHSS